MTRKRDIMKQLLSLVVAAVFMVVFTDSLLAQEKLEKKEKLKKYHRMDASYVIGGQLYNDNFLYNPGYGFSVSNGVLINKNIALGLGIGGQFFEDEKFLPIYIDLIAYKKKKKKRKSFINTQLGYSIGWNNSLSGLENYDYDGGVFIHAGIGQKIKISDDLSLMFQAAYRHQFAEISYESVGVKEYSETLNYDMLVLSVSLILESK